MFYCGRPDPVISQKDPLQAYSQTASYLNVSPGHISDRSRLLDSAKTRTRGRADGDRNAELSNANKSFADHRGTGDPPCSSPRRRAASTQKWPRTRGRARTRGRIFNYVLLRGPPPLQLLCVRRGCGRSDPIETPSWLVRRPCFHSQTAV
jgi:hypothetical protein